MGAPPSDEDDDSKEEDEDKDASDDEDKSNEDVSNEDVRDEDYSNDEGEKDDVHDKSNEDVDDKRADSLPRFEWKIEGLEGLGSNQTRHSEAFYALLKKWYAGKEYTAVLMTKEDYERRVEFLLYLRDGGDCRESMSGTGSSMSSLSGGMRMLSLSFAQQSKVL